MVTLTHVFVVVGRSAVALRARACGVRWIELTLDAATLTGWYKLDEHKNVDKGIDRPEG